MESRLYGGHTGQEARRHGGAEKGYGHGGQEQSDGAEVFGIVEPANGSLIAFATLECWGAGLQSREVNQRVIWGPRPS
jgi:hypothetical protein